MSDNTDMMSDDTNIISDNPNTIQFLKILLIAALMATLIVAILAKAKAVPFPFIYPQLRLYSTDPAVKTAKTLLTKQGSYYGLVNDYFGQDFEYAVINFQKKWNIRVDGIIGPETWKVALKK
jgi:peptidoglycan hydrolase-like protein with peptidoglycan-binding domain